LLSPPVPVKARYHTTTDVLSVLWSEPLIAGPIPNAPILVRTGTQIRSATAAGYVIGSTSHNPTQFEFNAIHRPAFSYSPPPFVIISRDGVPATSTGWYGMKKIP